MYEASATSKMNVKLPLALSKLTHLISGTQHMYVGGKSLKARK